ncbi:MAG: S8 family serine peptidase [Verrucomicrobia bacterium]|nr:S8 family serine peptidase [Verrucomicrobiota bacterium]
MNTPDPAPPRRLRRSAVCGILLLGIAAGFLLPIGNRLRGVRQFDSNTTPQGPVNAGQPRAAEQKPPVPESARAGLNRTHSPSISPIPQPNLPTLHFNGRQFGFDRQAPAALTRCQQQLVGTNTVVALIGLTVPGSTIRTDLAQRGIELLDYVPDQGWIARVHGRPDPLPDPRLFSFQPLKASLRIQPALTELSFPETNVPVYVHAVLDRTVTWLHETLQKAGFEGLTPLTVGDRSHLAGTIAVSRMSEFLQLTSIHPDTLWIERGRRARLRNAAASRTTQSGSYHGSTPCFDRGIFGVGQIIAVCDTGLDVDSCFFRGDPGWRPPVNRLDGRDVDPNARKILAVNFLDPADLPTNPLAWDTHGHGTAVAGTAAGASLFSPRDPEAGNGLAPGAKLIVQDAGFRVADSGEELPGLGFPVTNFYPALQQAIAQGATIHNHSWGEQEEGFPSNGYSQVCRELDSVTWSNPQVLVVCAAGNDFFPDTVGSPSTAKNALSVAASLSGLSEERVASFSSRGWASDGRIKPDLTAPGHHLYTAASDGDVTTENCYRTHHSGTSFAAPVVSGLAALVRDYFAQGFYPTGNPVAEDRQPEVSASLVKAVLINAATPMSGATDPPPSRDQGWGRVNLSSTLRLTPDAPALLALDESPGFAAAPAFPYKLYLRLTATHRPLKVTLVWTDYPATPGADRQLINDLDLRVRTPELELKGNRLIRGQSAPGGNYDRLNNVEQIVWLPPQSDLVEISVWAPRIVVGPQPFSLVATGDFKVVSPSADSDGDGLPDCWEQWHWNNLTPLPDEDPDADGASNATEFAANTHPNQANSVARLDISRAESGEPQLRLTVSEGRRYTLEHSAEHALQGPWTTVSEPLLMGEPIGEQNLQFTPMKPEPGAALASGFYRIRIDGPR